MTAVGYLLIESDGPNLVGTVRNRFAGDAARLAEDGEEVSLFLIENGVAGAVRGAAPEIEEFVRLGGDLWVDDFSLAQRALRPEDLVAGARTVAMDQVAETLLRPGVRAVWH